MKNLKKKLLFSLFSQQYNFKTKRSVYVNYKQLRFRLNEYSYGSIRDAVAKLNQVGAVDKLIKNQQSRCRLTVLGKELLTEEIKALKPAEKWLNYWSVVMLKGPNSQEKCQKLFKLGFKRFLRGVFLSFDDMQPEIKKLVSSNQWFGQVYFVKITDFYGLDNVQLAKKLWSLEEIAKKYENFINLADRVLKTVRTNLILLQQSKGGFKQVFDEYFSIISLDPGLPSSLLDISWPKPKADSMFYRLVSLAERANI